MDASPEFSNFFAIEIASISDCSNHPSTAMQPSLTSRPITILLGCFSQASNTS